MSAGTIILIIIGIIILLVLLGIFFFLFSLWKSVFVAREVLDKADTAMEWSKRANWLKKKLAKSDTNTSPQKQTSVEFKNPIE